MTSTTARLNAPYIVASQSQKEVTHNEALNILDAMVQTAIEDKDLSTPPGAPVEGGLWIVAASASGAWQGREEQLAHYFAGAWAFYTPPAGFSGWLKNEALTARWDGAAWRYGELAGAQLVIGGTKVVGAQAGAIADAAGGTTIDAEARAAINALLAACRSHGLIAP
jgi:hypothetical protein